MATIWSFLIQMQGNARQLEYAMGIAEKRMSGLEGTMVRVGRTMSAAGRAMTIGVTAPIALVGGAALKAAIDWETSWTSVVKTVSDGTPKVTAQLNVLQKDLRTMAQQIPVSVNDLNNIAAAGGALGVPIDQLHEYVDVVAKLSVSTNLTTDAASTALGHLRTVMKLTSGQFEELGSILVDLGNKGASTESEILGMATAIAGAGKIVGMTMPQILGWSAALANTGEATQAGGSSLQRFFLMSAKMIHDGGAELKIFAKIAGMSTKDFATAFDQNASGALQLFLDRLGKMPEKTQQATLGLLGFNDIRIVRALLKLLANTQNLDAALGLAAKDALEYVDSAGKVNYMNAEAQRRFGTMASQLKLFFNTVYEIGIELGEVLAPVLLNDILPALRDVAGAVKDGVQWFSKLDAGTRHSIIMWSLFVAALGPVLIIVGSVVSAVGGLIHLFKGIGGVVMGGVRAILGLGGILTGKSTAGGILGKITGTAGQRVFVTNWPPSMLMGGGKVKPLDWLPQRGSAAKEAAAAEAAAMTGLRGLINKIPLAVVGAIDVAAIVGVVATWFKVNGDIQVASKFEKDVVAQRQATSNLQELYKLRADLEAQIKAGGGDPLASLLKGIFVNGQLNDQLDELNKKIGALGGSVDNLAGSRPVGPFGPAGPNVGPTNTGPTAGMPGGVNPNAGRPAGPFGPAVVPVNVVESDYALRHPPTPSGAAAINPATVSDYALRHRAATMKPPRQIGPAEFMKDLLKLPFMGDAKRLVHIWEKFTTAKPTARDPFGQEFLALVEHLKNPKDPKVMTEINGHIRELQAIEQWYVDHGDVQAAAKVQGVIDQINVLIGVNKAGFAATAVSTAATKADDAKLIANTAVTGDASKRTVDALNRQGVSTANRLNTVAGHTATTVSWLAALNRKRWAVTAKVDVTVPITASMTVAQKYNAAVFRATKSSLLTKAAVYQTGAWEIQRKQMAQVDPGELVLPAKPAERFRKWLFEQAMQHNEAQTRGGDTYNIEIPVQGLVRAERPTDLVEPVRMAARGVMWKRKRLSTNG